MAGRTQETTTARVEARSVDGDVSAENGLLQRELTAWLEEYKALCSDVESRVRLQQSNVHVGILLLTAFTGYLVAYWNAHGLTQLETSEMAVLLVIVPLLTLYFVWRHIDHDSNIIDKADYIDSVVRPNVARCAHSNDVMTFDYFLRNRRVDRILQLSVLSALGNEHVLVLMFVLLYMSAAWYVRLAVPLHAGQAQRVFDYLLYFCSVLLALSLYMTGVTIWRYLKLGSDSSQ